MNIGPKLVAAIMMVGITASAGGQSSPSTSHAPNTNNPEASPALIARPRIVDDSGQVMSELFFPSGQKQQVVKLAHGAGIWATNELKINGHSVGWMIIDTGANVTVIDDMAADDAGVFARFPGQIHRATDRIELAGIALKNHHIDAFDLSALRAELGVSIKGLIGGDFLGLMPFCLDFKDGTLTFYARKGFVPPPGAHEERLQLAHTYASENVLAQANPTAGVPCITGQIENVRCSVILDTGTSFAMQIGPRLCQEFPEMVDWSSGFEKTTPMVNGSWRMHQTTVRKIGLFGQTIETDDILAETAAPTLIGAAHDDAVAGMRLMENYRLTFDYAAGRMWIEERALPTVAARLAAGMDSNVPDFAHHSPLMVAAERGDLPGVIALLRAGAKTDGEDSVGRTALLFAVSSGNLQVVNAVLAADRANVNHPMVGGTTPLMTATEQRSVDALVKVLLQAGADVSPTDSNGNAAVHFAALHSGATTIELLASKHANFNLANKGGQRPLDLVAMFGREDTLEAFWRAGARLADKGGVTLLYLAAANRDPAMIRHVLKGQEGPVEIDAHTSDGTTPLMHAAMHGNLDVVRVLVKAGAKTDLVANNQLDALCYAAPFADVVELLLKSGANPNAASAAQFAPLEAAAEEGDMKAVQLLLSAGAKIDRLRDAPGGRTALIAAAQSNHPDVIELLVKHKANLEATMPNGATALMGAAYNGSTEALCMLLRCGAAVNVARPDGATALHVAAQVGNAAAARLLIKAGANIEAAAKDGQRPLVLAALQKHTEVVRVLLAAGADPQAAMPDGHTPLEVAKIVGDLESVKLIKEAIVKRQAATKPMPPR